MSFNYVSKSAKIYVTTLTLADTWYEVLSAANAKAIRGLKVKSRMTYDSNGAPTHAPRPFDIGLSAAPTAGGSVTDGTGFISLSGGGTGDEFGPCNGLWARSTVAGAIIEVMVFC